MNLSTIKSPGVYIDEENAYSNTVIPVQTAVPAFIGYTPRADYEGKSNFNVAQKITSFSDFQAIYCLPNPSAPSAPAKQYNPQYYVVKQVSQPQNDDCISINDSNYSIVPDPNTIYYLYNSIRLFYENGGGDAYIVSVGKYGSPSGSPINAGEQIVNPNVKLNELTNGLSVLKCELEPTMYICPEATLLSVDNNATLMQEMLIQNTEMQTSISIFDIIGARNPDPIKYMNDIETFRTATGSKGLCYGTAYYPFVGTTIMQDTDLDYTNLFGGDIQQLATLINPEGNSNSTLTAIIDAIKEGNISSQQANNALKNSSKTYATIMKHVLADANVLPASGGIAGVITTIDNQEGVWYSPANASIVGVCSLPMNLSESQQADLNVDVVSGKSINAIRSFPGIGILIWGARTLDGNSQDWRYIAVRRTITFIEQSSKFACSSYVFQPNDKNTWESIKTVLGNFLNNLWKQGGLQGATASDAFSVQCGLGTTMTSEDILNGILRVVINVAIVHPAEYITIEFQVQMAES